MGEYDPADATTTTLNSDVEDYSVASKVPDAHGMQKETYYDFPNSSEYLGYYKTIPELKKAVDSLAIWTVGKGYTGDSINEHLISLMEGWGNDTFQSIMCNLVVQKKVFGDAFAEPIRDEKTKELINLKPLYTGDMRVVVNNKGIIVRYEQRSRSIDGDPVIYQPEEIFHISNDRIANEIHGTSVIEACKWVIDARNEALSDERKIKHRELALGVLYVDADSSSTAGTTAINNVIAKYSNAIKNGEVLVLPKDTAELKDSGVSPHQDRLAWISYLENFFYQAVGIPKVIANSSDYTEAASKIGYMTFEPVYTNEQQLLEEALYEQLGIDITFNRPPSLSNFMQQSESKNTGQLGIQQNEIAPSITKNE